MNSDDRAQFSRCFDTFQRSAFRLQTLARYNIDDERAEFEDFMRGAPKPSHADDSWLAEIAANVRSGKRMLNVHVLPKGLTDYLRYAIEWWYGDRAAAGEEVRFVLPDDRWRLGPSIADFWMFDDQTVALMHYDLDGRFLGPEILTEPVSVAPFVAIKSLALQHSIPLDQFLARRSSGLTE
jgi:hypothetical protein